jgi:hypothetical protein
MKKTEKKRNEKNQSAKYLKMQKQQRRFMQWMISDNVIRIKDKQSAYWTSQDSQYRNKMHTMLDAWNYYQREFINQ